MNHDLKLFIICALTAITLLGAQRQNDLALTRQQRVPSTIQPQPLHQFTEQGHGFTCSRNGSLHATHFPENLTLYCDQTSRTSFKAYASDNALIHAGQNSEIAVPFLDSELPETTGPCTLYQYSQVFTTQPKPNRPSRAAFAIYIAYLAANSGQAEESKVRSFAICYCPTQPPIIFYHNKISIDRLLQHPENSRYFIVGKALKDAQIELQRSATNNQLRHPLTQYRLLQRPRAPQPAAANDQSTAASQLTRELFGSALPHN